MVSLGVDGAESSTEEFVPAAIVSSGHISVEREMFRSEEGIYRDDLRVPAAEEYELSYRLRVRGIPLLSAKRIVAMHDHPVTLDSMCRQTFKHAVGCAEAAVKCPSTLELQEVHHIMATNGPRSEQDGPPALCRKAVKQLLASAPSRAALLWIVKWIERVAPSLMLLSPFYRMVMGLHFFAGVREGIRFHDRLMQIPGLQQAAASQSVTAR
jgi:hypothetical protein